MRMRLAGYVARIGRRRWRRRRRRRRTSVIGGKFRGKEAPRKTKT
jgi:hypothetical protein